MKDARHFAVHGSEKMIYDIRMGPQCLHHDGTFWVAYQANPDGGRALPCVMERNPNGVWSEPVVLGDVTRYDHHYAPVLWCDAEERIHVLYHCHSGHNQARHLISSASHGVYNWKAGPSVAPSISYPRILRLRDGRLALYYRALGHMGFWTCRLSDDGGYTWKPVGAPHVDFDYLPHMPGDEWAGSYHSAAPARDGRSLHVAFVYWDERSLPHPRYGRTVGHMNRCNLYYLRLDLLSGRAFNIDGRLLELPLNLRNARSCLVWDTEGQLSNMPSIAVDEDDSPCFLMPVSEDAIDRCRFWFIRRTNDGWMWRAVTPTGSTWNGSHVEFGEDGALSAFLIGPSAGVGNCPYGGGSLQEWRSADGGTTWRLADDLTPQSGLLCNNPKPVESVDGSLLKRSLVFFGWEGPDGILPDGAFTGRAYLWQDGKWL